MGSIDRHSGHVDDPGRRPPDGPLDPPRFLPADAPRGPEPQVGETADQPRERPDRPPEPHPDRPVSLPPDADRGPEPQVDETGKAGRPRDRADGGWEWPAKGYELSPPDNATADRALDARKVAEPAITGGMRRIESDLENGRLEGCPGFTLKTPDSFKEKVAQAIEREPDTPTHELAEKVHDGIRYTFVFDPDRYTDGVNEAVSLLRANDYESLRLKNLWGETEYKGINSQWLDPMSGQTFEVQFHTPESWATKQVTHGSYEKIRTPTTPAAEVARLRSYQAERTAVLRVPRGASTIEDYPGKDR